MNHFGKEPLPAFIGLMLMMSMSTYAMENSSARVSKIVKQIQQADYADDRPALKRLHGELAPFTSDKQIASRVLYWQGFALWRRAINGFNDHAEPSDLQADLKQAMDEFHQSFALDEKFVDAKIAELSSYGFLTFSTNEERPSSETIQAFIAQARQMRNQIEALDPENPRFWWIVGPMTWNSPPDHGGGPDKAIAGYENGLASIREHNSAATSELDPTWGEPELLMSLAWSNLHKPTPDLPTAEKQARAALAIVPEWHYVRDILLPQILSAESEAKKQAESEEPVYEIEILRELI